MLEACSRQMAPARDRRDLELDLVISGGCADESPSVTATRSWYDNRDEDWRMATADQQVRAEEPQKILSAHQEGAVVSHNPRKPGRPSHAYHAYLSAAR